MSEPFGHKRSNMTPISASAALYHARGMKEWGLGWGKGVGMKKGRRSNFHHCHHDGFTRDCQLMYFVSSCVCVACWFPSLRLQVWYLENSRVPDTSLAASARKQDNKTQKGWKGCGGRRAAGLGWGGGGGERLVTGQRVQRIDCLRPNSVQTSTKNRPMRAMTR